MLSRVLLVIDSEPLRRRLRTILSEPGISVRSPRITRQTFFKLARESADLIVLSPSRVPDPFLESIAVLSQTPDAADILIVAECENPQEEATLRSAGCEGVLNPRLGSTAMADLLHSLLDRQRLRRTSEARPSGPMGSPRLSDFVSSSIAMQAFLAVVERVVRADTSLLILGETGVGKERLARAIHAESSRADGPFVAVNCGALPEGLLESELFGHEEGSFTGATRSRRGHFELAHGGTLFLDEIGEMPLHLQVKLLRVLQDHEFQPIGSESPLRVDVRVMAATNRDLAAAADQGVFRRDLFYRLGVLALTLPTLRERQEDIPALVESYVEHYRAIIGREVTSIHPDALAAMVNHHWPGNVRELMNVIERAVLLCNGTQITIDLLPPEIARAASPEGSGLEVPSAYDSPAGLPVGWEDRPWREVREEILSRMEKVYLGGQLSLAGGRIGMTAERAGMTTRSLHEKMTRLGLRKEDYR